MKEVKYRPDIDGLRAIAILLVVGYHAFPTAIKGGFMGVDIFFVISGFLISSIILRNLAKGKFSLFEFYYRRIRRIFPALTIVLISAWCIGWYVLYLDEFQQFGMHMIGGVGFASNFVLLSEAGYFDNSSAMKPLMHLWSLGIEEQFYLLCPILLWAAWKKKYNILIIIIYISILSFLANIYFLFFISQTVAFYLPLTRFWELTIGIVLACLVLQKKDWMPKVRAYSNFLSIIGCFLIILGIVFLDKDELFPGWWALLPTLGAFFVISAPGSWINSCVLSHRVPVYIGLMSYPLYLWHWVILSFSNILKFTNVEARIIGIGLSFILACLTYEFIEKQVRRKGGNRTFFVLLFLSFVLLCLGCVTYKGWISPRNDAIEAVLIHEAVDDLKFPIRGMENHPIDGVDFWVKKGAERKVLFYGDSHIEQYAARISELIDRDPLNSKTAIFATSGGCPPIPNVYEDKHTGCTSHFRETIKNLALSPEIDSVVIGASWNYLVKIEKLNAGEYRYYYSLKGDKKYFDDDGIDYAYQSLENFIASISKYKKVYLVIDQPTGDMFDPKQALSSSRIQASFFNPNFFQKYDEKQAEVRVKMNEMAKRSNAIIIDPVEHLCKDSECRAVLDDGTPIYSDSNHLRSSFVRQFAEYMDLTVKK